MKNILFALSLLFPLMSFAQLKAPSSSKADTLIVVTCSYNGTTVEMDDWPARYFTETPQAITIAGQRYIKNKQTDSQIHDYISSWKGYVNYYSWSNATVNGKRANLYRVDPTEGCESYPASKYGIDDYSIYAVNLSTINAFWPTLLDTVREKLAESESPELVDEKMKKLFGGPFEDRLVMYQYIAMSIIKRSDSE